mmetsp:Transcript_9126/g.19331  ORF Transcript_9126/g.19331 Transcript_9126/m.19331 type:complete len:80 (+) Transcript_9126:44-283(+)|eukprot:CAMPEP_0185844030 /NCGR_PEP_ID=MMETSP1354-20130828/354_1 /TAXON_ID=708628 /ORGANISM="Erythrolobus madagascarensis, Strain CCMP3276" /LENGTH=79 /DNA_ID=CAMNT_0028543637 /DNA_START=44 /DNA_END=283 /DNA_ORIENTATION=+
MTVLGAIGGGVMGVFWQTLNNGLRKQPMMRHPWEMVAAVGVGMWFGHKFPQWTENLETNLERERARKLRFIQSDKLPKA